MGGAPTAADQARAQAVEAAAAIDEQARQWGMVAYAAGQMLAVALPELQAVYSEDRCLAWGAAMVPVAEKYGWRDGPGSLPELGLLAASLSLAVPTWAAIKAHKLRAAQAAQTARIEAERERVQAEAAQEVQADGSDA